MWDIDEEEEQDPHVPETTKSLFVIDCSITAHLGQVINALCSYLRLKIIESDRDAVALT